jgi:hypothetical protein
LPSTFSASDLTQLLTSLYLYLYLYRLFRPLGPWVNLHVLWLLRSLEILSFFDRQAGSSSPFYPRLAPSSFTFESIHSLDLTLHPSCDLSNPATSRSSTATARRPLARSTLTTSRSRGSRRPPRGSRPSLRLGTASARSTFLLMASLVCSHPFSSNRQRANADRSGWLLQVSASLRFLGSEGTLSSVSKLFFRFRETETGQRRGLNRPVLISRHSHRSKASDGPGVLLPTSLEQF